MAGDDGRHQPGNAAPGTIRGDLATEMQNNVTHGSDSPESAAREIALFFPASGRLNPGAGTDRAACPRQARSALHRAGITPRAGHMLRLGAGKAVRAIPDSSSLRALAGRDMAVDLGTANTLVYVRGRGIVLNEPSVVADQPEHGASWRRRHRGQADDRPHPGQHRAPSGRCEDGVIADFDTTERMLRYFIQKVHKRRPWPGPASWSRVPCGHHRRRAARGRGRRLRRRRAQGLHHRGADGRGDRRRAARPRAHRATWSSTSAVAPPRSPSSPSAAS